MNDFGVFLKELRGERSLREMEKITGLSHTYLSSLEKGKDPRSGNERKPSPEVLKKIARTLNVNYSTLMEKAGYADEQDELEQISFFKLNEFKLKRYVRIEDFLEDPKRKFSINGHILTKEEIQNLISSFKGKTINYPTDEEIEKEYEEIITTKINNKERIENGDAFFIVDENYDID